MSSLDRRSFIAAGAVSTLGLFARKSVGADAPKEAARFWPQWRGPLATGEAPQARPPVEWAEGKNIRWKVELPGQGKSTPIVWRDVLYLTAAVPSPKQMPPRAEPAGTRTTSAGGTFQFVVLALDRKDGRIRWSRTVREEHPHEGTHQDGSLAGGSVVTDGTTLYASFGSRGVYALDLAGKVLWEKDLGLMRTRNGFGEGSSPALHDGVLVVNWDHEGADFIAAFDGKSGRELWRRERDEPTGWSTPHVVVHDGRAHVVVAGTNAIRSYELKTGAPLWEAPGLTTNVIPSPVSGDGVLYAMSGFRGSALRAVRLKDAKDTLSGPPALAWSYDRDTPYVPSPLLYQGGLYFLKSNSGILTRLDATTGVASFTERLEGVPNVYASPVAADGRVYVTGREGACMVLEGGPKLKVLATNRLEDGFDASPALVDGELYLRGKKHLYRISA